MKHLNNFFTKLRRTPISLRTSILIIFILLMSITSFLLITIGYVNASNSLVFIANQSMKSLSSSLHSHIDSVLKSAEHENKLSLDLINDGVIDENKPEEMAHYFQVLAGQFYISQAIYYGTINGEFISVEYQEHDNTITDIIKRTPEKFSHQMIYRDNQNKVTDKKLITNVDFDPRKRPWYTEAVKAGKTIWTNIYLFKRKTHLGISIATPLYTPSHQLKGVLGIDIRLDWVSWFIAQQKLSEHGRLFILSNAGEVLAYPGLQWAPKQTKLLKVNQLDDPPVLKSFNYFKATHEKMFEIVDGGKDYLANFTPLTDFKGMSWILGIVAPKSDFVGNLGITRIINVLIGFVLLFLGIYLVSKLVTRVIIPLKRVIKETEKIRNFELEGDGRTPSRIKEINQLSEEIHAMKNGLRAFKSYVPATLVKQLIARGEHAKLGGKKKNIVVFFSDIQDFTTISHTISPNELMEQISQYFEALSSIITQELGTIDKYIGDSIMAFWGAPVKVDSPCRRAVEAALRCVEKLEVLNRGWLQANKMPFYTRIGIHQGEAIVGNVGSRERINYTAVGDTINIASRLEEANKLFGTKVLVSEIVYQEVKDFYDFKKHGPVTLKGLPNADFVYELLGRK